MYCEAGNKKLISTAKWKRYKSLVQLIEAQSNRNKVSVLGKMSALDSGFLTSPKRQIISQKSVRDFWNCKITRYFYLIFFILKFLPWLFCDLLLIPWFCNVSLIFQWSLDVLSRKVDEKYNISHLPPTLPLLADAMSLLEYSISTKQWVKTADFPAHHSVMTAMLYALWIVASILGKKVGRQVRRELARVMRLVSACPKVAILRCSLLFSAWLVWLLQASKSKSGFPNANLLCTGQIAMRLVQSIFKLFTASAIFHLALLSFNFHFNASNHVYFKK